MESTLRLWSLGAASGVLSHNLWFIRGEHLLRTPLYAVLALATPVSLPVVLYLLQDYTILQAIQWTTIALTAYVMGLFSSITIYRLFFHPLRNFPGPFWARVTALYMPISVARQERHSRAAWNIDRLHGKYGEYFRVGPNVLSIADPDMVETIHAPGTKFGKAEGYDIGLPRTTLHQMRDKAVHDRRRRTVWDAAFTTKALRSYDSKVLEHSNTLVKQLHQISGQATDATHWANCFAFDVMGSLAFGRSFNATATGKQHFYMKILHDNVLAGAKMGGITWLSHLLVKFIPPSVSPQVAMLHYSNEALQHRKLNPPEEPDIMSFLLDAPPQFPNDPHAQQLLEEGEVRLLIVAGSDTTSTTLINLLYRLARDCSLAVKLRKELEENSIRNDETFTVQKLSNLSYLNALINETLRMHPPTPGGVARMTPAGGTTINGKYLPGGVTVLTPMVTIQRSPKAFVDPDTFIPERWTTRPDLVLKKQAFFPFSMNSWSCIGKQLALNELRTVVTKLVLEFDITLAESETGEELLENSKDGFTTVNGRLNLVFTARSL